MWHFAVSTKKNEKRWNFMINFLINILIEGILNSFKWMHTAFTLDGDIKQQTLVLKKWLNFHVNGKNFQVNMT